MRLEKCEQLRHSWTVRSERTGEPDHSECWSKMYLTRSYRISPFMLEVIYFILSNGLLVVPV